MDIAELPVWTALLVAVAAGAVSFLSPCVAPLVPGYLAFIASGERAAGTPLAPAAPSLRIVRSGAFIAGFSTVFTVLGASIGSLTDAVDANRSTLAFVSGTIVALLGLATMFGRSPLHALSARGGAGVVRRLRTPSGCGGAFIVGSAFAVAWSPCIGPVLAAILALAGGSGSAGPGGALLLAYSIGLGVPFMLAAVALDRVLARSRALRQHALSLRVASGLVLLVMGIAIASGQFGTVAARLARLVPAYMV